MTYRLVIVEPAESDVDGIYASILARSSQGAAAWCRAFLACTERIVLQPLACSIAPESAEFEFELQQALFKTRLVSPTVAYSLSWTTKFGYCECVAPAKPRSRLLISLNVDRAESPAATNKARHARGDGPRIQSGDVFVAAA